MPSGAGAISGVNANGDPCDQYHNIFIDPKFVDAASLNFNLRSDSPCIDAGDPSLPYDPDGTIADMGALYHDQTPAPEIQLSCNQLLFGSVTIGDHSDLPLTIYNVGDADLIIYDIYTSDPCFTTDFDPADSLILPGNDLTVTVTFAPEEAIPYIETLYVESNDVSMEVGMLGIGEEAGGVTSDPYGEIPDMYVFEAPYPNPFNPNTTFEFSLPEAASINLTIYNASGSVLSELVDGWLYAGHYSVSFDATGMPSGIYFYHLSGGEFRSAGKMVLMK